MSVTVNTEDFITVSVSKEIISQIPILEDLITESTLYHRETNDIELPISSESLNKLIEYIQLYKSKPTLNKLIEYFKESFFTKDISKDVKLIRDIDFVRFDLSHFYNKLYIELYLEIFIILPYIFDKITLNINYWNIYDFFNSLRKTKYDLTQFDLLFKFVNKSFSYQLSDEFILLLDEFIQDSENNFSLRILIRLRLDQLIETKYNFHHLNKLFSRITIKGYGDDINIYEEIKIDHELKYENALNFFDKYKNIQVLSQGNILSFISMYNSLFINVKKLDLSNNSNYLEYISNFLKEIRFINLEELNIKDNPNIGLPIENEENYNFKIIK